MEVKINGGLNIEDNYHNLWLTHNGTIVTRRLLLYAHDYYIGMY